MSVKMQNYYKYQIKHPDLSELGYLAAVANINDKHDRSAPSHYHWKILKCRMIIFSNSSILACPDKTDVKQVHIVFNKMSGDYDKLNSLFLKFSLMQNGDITTPTPEMIQMCISYTLTAKMAPTWNIIGANYLINNRDFLNCIDPQDGVSYHVRSNDQNTVVEVKPVKIHFIAREDDEKFMPGEWVRVLPSLNKAVVEDYFDTLSPAETFKCYKDLRRHWKNIHGYRLPEEECPYYSVRFWRGDPLTYPKICIVRQHPIITPVPKPVEKIILAKFLSSLQARVTNILCKPLTLKIFYDQDEQQLTVGKDKYILDTQAISLCTPTQQPNNYRPK